MFRFEPALRGFGLVVGVVIDDQMQVKIDGRLLVDGLEEARLAPDSGHCIGR